MGEEAGTAAARSSLGMFPSGKLTVPSPCPRADSGLLQQETVCRAISSMILVMTRFGAFGLA